MPDVNITKPDVVIRLTREQLQEISTLKKKQYALNGGMIFGSVGLTRDDQSGDTIALSYIPHDLAKEIAALAFQKLGGETDVNS